MDAPSPIQAGLKAIRGAGAGATVADGHELTADQAALVPARKIGRVLPADEAERLLAKLEASANQAPSGLASPRNDDPPRARGDGGRKARPQKPGRLCAVLFTGQRDGGGATLLRSMRMSCLS
jgi:hypothetical protein